MAATPEDPATPRYPWYAVVQGNTLEQGDLLRNCPRFTLGDEAAQASSSVVQRDIVDAIILSQSCDLVVRASGDCEATDVLFCPVYTRSDLAAHPTFRRDAVWEEVRKGRRPCPMGRFRWPRTIPTGKSIKNLKWEWLRTTFSSLAGDQFLLARWRKAVQMPS